MFIFLQNASKIIITESLIPDDVHQFLVQFFSQNISDNDWQIKIDDLRSSEQNNLITALVRILRRTLPQLYVVIIIILIHFSKFCSNHFSFG